MKTKPKDQNVVILANRAEQQIVLRALEASRGTKPVTLSQVIHQWSNWLIKRRQARSASNQIVYINAWARDMELGDKPVCDLDEDGISDWVNSGATKRGTRMVKLSVIRSLFFFLRAKNLIGADPSQLVSVQHSKMSHAQKETRPAAVFTETEFTRLLAHLDGLIAEHKARLNGPQTVNQRIVTAKLDTAVFWRIAAVISRCVGLRLGDICQLEWEVLNAPKFTVWTDKRDKRVQPYVWNAPLFDSALASIPAEDSQHCFPKARETILDPTRRHKLSTQFGRICAAAGMPGHSFHSLRHTYCTECSRAGIPTPHIAASVGHSSTTTTAGYIH